ncbi:MAG: hypothetical protein IH851_05460 [Armatimonadetes bacterium]|nr:hypothetical protein [Armatimonadota bacterium]
MKDRVKGRFIWAVLGSGLLFVSGHGGPAGGDWRAAADIVAQLASEQTPGEKLRDRMEFARAYQKVQDGMSRDEVRALLGDPEEVIKVRLRPYSESSSERWGYGSNGPDTFATLGWVWFDRDSKVHYADEDPGLPSAQLPSEQTVRKVLRAVASASTEALITMASPLRTIQAVNAIVDLGRTQGLATLHEYFRVGGIQNDIGALCIIRMIFEVPDPPGYMLLPRIGEIFPRRPFDRRAAPRYPFALVAGVPLDLHCTLAFFGGLDGAERHLEDLEGKCKFRKEPLVPTCFPWELPAALFDPPYGTLTSCVLGSLKGQVLRLVETVYRIDNRDMEHSPFNRTPVSRSWKRIFEDLRKLDMRWDEAKNMYTFTDGSTLPPLKPFKRPPPRYEWMAWAPKILEPFAGGIVLERQTSRRVSTSGRVSIEFYHALRNDREVPPMSVRVYLVSRPDETLVTIESPWAKHISGEERQELGFDDNGRSYSKKAGKDFGLAEGESVVIELTFGDKVVRSEALKP